MLIVLSIIGVLLFILIAFMFFLIMVILVKIDNNLLDNERVSKNEQVKQLKSLLRQYEDTNKGGVK